MSNVDPIELMFGGLGKLGPSSSATTRSAIRAFPESKFDTVVDAGCGTGAQTMVLAEELQQLVNSIDNHEQFLRELEERAEAAGIGQFVATHCFDLDKLVDRFPRIDLLWCEGAAYNIGFANAIQSWATALKPNGYLAVSELCWLSREIPDSVQAFFDEGYPEMKFLEENISVIADSGYRILDSQTLPSECWVAGYYDILETRAQKLVDHTDEGVRSFAEGTLQEIEIYRQSMGCYGYVLFTLQLNA